MIKCFVLLALMSLSSCSQLYHYQLGDIDQSQGGLRAFSVQVNQLGIDVSHAAKLGAELVKGEQRQRLKQVEFLVALTNMGPRTGQPVYDDNYADKIMDYVMGQCPSGKVTGISSYREALSSRVISGEIVSIRGYCIE